MEKKMFVKYFSQADYEARNFSQIIAALIFVCSAILLNACVPTTVEGGANGSAGGIGTSYSVERTDEAAACVEQGGRWEVLGFSGPGCNLPSSDGGKVCTDIRDCDGLCLADNEEIMVDNGQGILVPDPKMIDEINSQGKELEGVCSMWQSDFGCHAVVEKSKIVVICID
jgi:hypothetical protein